MDIIFLLLLISFIGAFFFGLIIIKKQVALIKKGEFSYKDRLNCVIYGIIFALAVLIVEGMGFIIAIESPDYWTNTTPPEFHSEYFLIPFIICLFYISIYPLIDFLHMALIKTGDEGLTPFHKFFGEKIINKTNNKVINILIAICFYAVIFIIPPIVLSRILFLPFLVVWISWMLIYPLLIICFYGARGHIAVLLNAFYHIPDIKRLFFMNMRMMKKYG